MLPIGTIIRLYILHLLIQIYLLLDDSEKASPDATQSDVSDDIPEPEYSDSRMLIHVSNTMELESIVKEDRGASHEIRSLLPYWTPLMDKYIEENNR